MRANNPYHPFRRLGGILALVATLALGACTTADDLADTDPIGPLPHRYYDHFWQFETEYRQALAGDCSGVEEVLAREPPDPPLARLTAEFEGQLYDQDLCLPYDPAAAFGAFRKAEELAQIGIPLAGAWKRWYGHGTEHAPEIALDIFALWAAVYPYETDGAALVPIVHKALAGRSLPPPLLEAIPWGVRLHALPDPERTRFALDLIRGDAKDWRGAHIPPSRLAGSWILSWLYHRYPQAYYDFGLAAVQGTLPGISWDIGRSMLYQATRHCLEGSFLALSKAYEHTATEKNDRLVEAYTYLREGELEGFPLANERERVGRLLDASTREILDGIAQRAEPVGCASR